MGRPLKAGITGGIGSGKSTVAGLFRILGIPVYDADSRAKWLMAHDAALKRALRAAFGEQTFSSTGELDRKYLARVVFKDPEKLKQLNALVHPAVARDAIAWHERQGQVPYTLKEAALLYESGSFRDLDFVIVVTAPEETRIERVMRRDGLDRGAVEVRIQNQWPEDQKAARADFVIHNDGRQSLIAQVMAIHRALTRQWQQHSP